MANTTGEGNKVTHAGWTLRRAGMGPVIRATGAGSGYTNGAVILITAGTGAVNTSGIITTNATGGIVSIGSFGNNGGKFPNTSYITVSNPNGAISAITVVTAGAGYNNGDVLTISNGSVNATINLGANATGNVANATVVVSGVGFGANATTVKSVLASNGSATGNGVTSITISAAGGGYSNTDTVLLSNGTVNATATLTTNAAGNIATVTVTNSGSGFKGPTNTAVTILAANGAASLGSAATLTPVETSATFSTTADTGTNANVVVVLGGRAGRVNYETLIAMSSINANTGSNTAQLPE